MSMLPIFIYLASYLLGSIPFGYLVAKAHGVDILHTGSGSTGTTNIGRTIGKGPAVLVFVLDVIKGLIPPLAAKALLRGNEFGLTPADHAVLAGLCAIIGHTASPFIRFKGGKGIATGLGVLSAATPVVALCALGSFIVLFAASRIVSVASMAAVSGMVIGAAVTRQTPLCIVVYLALGGYVVYRHRANLRRLSKGEEPKFQFKR